MSTNIQYRSNLVKQTKEFFIQAFLLINFLFTSFSDRVFIQSDKTRKLLAKLVSLRFNSAEREQRHNVLQRSHCVLYRFLDECERFYGGMSQVPPGILTLLRCMSTPSPVCSYIPASEEIEALVLRLEEGMIIKKEPTHLLLLQNSAPVLFDALKTFPEIPLPDYWIDLLKELCIKGNACFSSASEHILNGPNDEDSPASFFPAWPTLRERGRYKMDKKLSAEENCSKFYRGHPNLMPGIFTLYCQHGKQASQLMCCFIVQNYIFHSLLVDSGPYLC